MTDTVNFPLPAPIKLGAAPQPGQKDTRRDYSLSDMVAHFGRRAREYNSSAEAARAYRRTQDAIDAPDSRGNVTLLRSDLTILKSLAEQPRCGWVEAKIPFEEEVDDGKGGTRVRKGSMRVNFAAHHFLPLVDAIPVP